MDWINWPRKGCKGLRYVSDCGRFLIEQQRTVRLFDGSSKVRCRDIKEAKELAEKRVEREKN